MRPSIAHACAHACNYILTCVCISIITLIMCTRLIILLYRPGVTRLSFPYFMSRETVDFITDAVSMVARHGWKLLPQVST